MFESGEFRGHEEVLAQVRQLCSSIDPARLAPADVGPLFESLAAMRKLLDAAVTRVAPRYERTGAWQDRGARSAGDAIAKATGETPANSKRRLEAAKKLSQLEELDAALRTGTVSSEQAQVIAGSATDGRTEHELLEVAVSSDHRTLRDEAARARARSDRDEHARRDRQRRLRRVSRWCDEDGMYNLHLRTLPEIGAEIDARLKPLIDDEFAEARKEDRRDPVPAYAADAMVRLLTDEDDGTSLADDGCDPAPRRRRRRSGQAVRPERKVIAVVDVAALRRGYTEGDEACEIAGVGPVSVTAARALLGDAMLAIAIRDAVDIRSVVHLRRPVTAEQRTALEARGPRCGIVGCGSTHQLEIDHTIGFTHTQCTRTDDLEFLCSTDHDIKTRLDLLAIGPPGQRVLVERDPDDPTRPKMPLVQVRPRPDRGDPPEPAADAGMAASGVSAATGQLELVPHG